jgi:hypothetical protein
MGSGVNRLSSALERVPPLYYEQVFFVFVLGYVSLMMWDARTYRPAVALFPVLVGVVVIAFLILQLLSPVLPDRLTEYTGGLIETDEEELDLGTETDRGDRMTREAAAVVWVVALLAIVYLFGFLAAPTFFVFAFVYYNERSLRLASFATVLTTVLTYGLFVLILDVRLFEGVIY